MPDERSPHSAPSELNPHAAVLLSFVNETNESKIPSYDQVEAAVHGLVEQYGTAVRHLHNALKAYPHPRELQAARAFLKEASNPASVPEREGGEQNPTSALSPTPNSIRQRAEGESRSETPAEQSPARQPAFVDEAGGEDRTMDAIDAMNRREAQSPAKEPDA